MINTYIIIILIGIIANLFSGNKQVEVNSNYYLDNFLNNTTRLEIYSNNLTDIYLNNQNVSQYYLNITNLPQFSNIIKESKYNITLSTSPVFFNDLNELTRCEINTYVKDKKGNYGTLIIDYLSNEFSMDPVNIFKSKENVNFYNTDIFKTINCTSLKDRVTLNINFSSLVDNNIRLNNELIKYTDKVFYKNGIFDKIYYDSSLVDPIINVPNSVFNFSFIYKDLFFEKIDSIFYFKEGISFIAGMWDNI
jgi:hypothetical protein